MYKIYCYPFIQATETPVEKDSHSKCIPVSMTWIVCSVKIIAKIVNLEEILIKNIDYSTLSFSLTSLAMVVCHAVFVLWRQFVCAIEKALCALKFSYSSLFVFTICRNFKFVCIFFFIIIYINWRKYFYISNCCLRRQKQRDPILGHFVGLLFTLQVLNNLF